MRIVFWQNILSFHQAPHIRALARQHEVVLVAEADISNDRKSLGWSVPDTGNAQVVIDPSTKVIQSLIREKVEESIHIFSGINSFPMVEKAFHYCLATRARMGLLVENRDDRGLIGLGRLMMYRRDRYRFGHRISFILNMGYDGPHGGRHWYRRCGYPEAKIFPYGYFVDPPVRDDILTSLSSRSALSSGPVQLMYLGQFVSRKGVDLLLDALALLREQDWMMKIVGGGPMKKAWMDRAKCRGLHDRIQFLPVMSNNAALEVLADSDLFILPSRFDGWGVVVNEALQRGVPVICSDRCGASDLLKASWRGETFISESIPDLGNVLRRWISCGKRTPERTQRIKNWSCCIQGDVAADYLLAVLAHCDQNGPRPMPPWFSAHDT